jgi:FtsH-binding integral membrane protein
MQPELKPGGRSAVGTGAIFLTMGVIATTTKRDFSFMCA